MKRMHKQGYAILGGLFALCLGCGGVVNAFSDDDAAPAAGQTQMQQPARVADLPPATTSATQIPSPSSPAARLTATTTRPTTAPRAIRTTGTTRTTTATRRPTVRRTTTTPKPRRTTEKPRREVYYANCSAVRAAGADPIYRGDPGYSRKLDRDGDGVACE